MTVTAARRRECERVLSSIEAWAGGEPDLRAVAVVGSWARGRPEMTSDLDLVVLTDDEGRYVGNDRWVVIATGQVAAVVRTLQWRDVT